MPGGKQDSRQLRSTSVSDPDFWDNLRLVIGEEVRKAVKDELSESHQKLEDLSQRLSRLEDNLAKTQEVQKAVEGLQESMQFQSDRLEGLATASIPALASHMEKVTSALALQTLDMDMHRRKWSLIIQGLKGNPKEDENDTRQKVVDLARGKLELGDSSPGDFAACHRLKSAANAGIIVRFKDLNTRNQWLAVAKRLKGHQDHVTISPDIPPPLRCCKSELLNIRKEMPAEKKRRSYVRQLPRWPYAELVVPDGQPLQHSFSKNDIIKSALNLDTPLGFTLQEETQAC